jgi:hypothetical protein
VLWPGAAVGAGVAGGGTGVPADAATGVAAGLASAGVGVVAASGDTVGSGVGDGSA